MAISAHPFLEEDKNKTHICAGATTFQCNDTRHNSILSDSYAIGHFYAKCFFTDFWNTECHYAECQNAEWHYAKCRYVECHADCYYDYYHKVEWTFAIFMPIVIMTVIVMSVDMSSFVMPSVVMPSVVGPSLSSLFVKLLFCCCLLLSTFISFFLLRNVDNFSQRHQYQRILLWMLNHQSMTMSAIRKR